MTDLKTKIARGEYEIDSCEVAEEILAKMRTVTRVRTQLEGPSVRRPRRRFAGFAIAQRERPAARPALAP